jgi:hypothetical protein
MPMFGQSTRKQHANGGKKRKGACKNPKMDEHNLERMEARYELPRLAPSRLCLSGLQKMRMQT